MKKLIGIFAVLGLICFFTGRVSADLPNDLDLIYGLKSHDPISGPPTNLFSFGIDGISFTDIGAVTLDGSNIDVDGLALSPTYGLMAFQIVGADSLLISIDPTTTQATEAGVVLEDRNIRGAAFDSADTLWAVDVENDVLLQIDPSNGAILGTPLSLTLDGVPFDVSSQTDIAIKQGTTLFLVDGRLNDTETLFLSLNKTNGKLTNVAEDKIASTDGYVPGLSGAAFSRGEAKDILFGYDVQEDDDLFSYDTGSEYSRTLVHGNIIPSFNAGRGDLASVSEGQTIWPTGNEAIAASYGADTKTTINSSIVNNLTFLIIPIGAVFFLRILRRRK